MKQINLNDKAIHVGLMLPPGESKEVLDEIRAWAEENGMKLGRAYYKFLKLGFESLKCGTSSDKIIPY